MLDKVERLAVKMVEIIKTAIEMLVILLLCLMAIVV